MIQNKITKQKIEKYISITEKALKIAEKSVNPKMKKQAKEILEMVSCYLSDSKHFKEKKDYINSFASVNYSHGWLDSGARLKIFVVDNSDLFTI
jgi:hypothetical protein